MAVTRDFLLEEIKHLLDDVGDFLSNTLKKEKLKKEVGAKRDELAQQIIAVVTKVEKILPKEEQEEYADVEVDPNAAEEDGELYEDTVTPIPDSPNKNVMSQGSDRDVPDEPEPPEASERDDNGDAYGDMKIGPIAATDIVKPVMEGYLEKRRKEGQLGLQLWQKRYCVIKDNIFYYFKNRNDKQQKNVILLTGYEARPNPDYDKKHKKRDFLFEVVCPAKRSFQFIAQSAEEMKTWTDAIAAASKVVSAVVCPSDAAGNGVSQSESEVDQFGNEVSRSKNEVNKCEMEHSGSEVIQYRTEVNLSRTAEVRGSEVEVDQSGGQYSHLEVGESDGDGSVLETDLEWDVSDANSIPKCIHASRIESDKSTDGIKAANGGEGHCGCEKEESLLIQADERTSARSTTWNSSGSEDTSIFEGSVFVMMTNNTEKRCYDKTDYCFFCHEPHKKLRTHLNQHRSEALVAEYLAEGSPSRKNILLAKLRNMGNHHHNCEVMKNGWGIIVPVYRPNYLANPYNYQPCVNCLGWYSRTEMWKHRCTQKSQPGAVLNAGVRAGRLLQPAGRNLNPRFQRLLGGLRTDRVSLCIRNDPMIMALGEQLCLNLGHTKENENVIRCQLRAVARLLLEYRARTGIRQATVLSLLSPGTFRNVVKAAKTLGGFDEATQTFDKPSYSIKIGHSLKKIALLAVSKAPMQEDQDLERKARGFLKLYNARWESEVSSHAHHSLCQGKKNAPKLPPLTSDVVKLTKYLQEKSEECLKAIRTNPQGDRQESLTKLRKLTLAHLTIFNCRRQGEVSRMKLADYGKAQKGLSRVVEDPSLDEWEQMLIGKMWRVEVVGNHGRTVPIMLTDLMKTCTDTIVEFRKEVGIRDDNPYVFAVSGTDSHIRGCDVMREFSVACGAQNPHLLRATRLDKHIVTVMHAMNLNENDLDALSSYMGHGIDAHQAFDRLSDPTGQVAKLSQMLLALEGSEPAALLQRTQQEDFEVQDDEELDIEFSVEDDVSDDEEDMPEKREANEMYEEVGPSSTGKKRRLPENRENERSAESRPKRRKWSPEEELAVTRHLGQYIVMRTLPGKKEIIRCQEREQQTLRGRTWTNIKDFIRNKITANARL